MNDAAPCRKPLRVASAKARGGAQRIGVIDVAAPDDGHRLESAMRVLRKSGYDRAVVHAKAVLDDEVLAELSPGERGRGPHLLVARGVRVVVVHAEQKWIDGLPGEAEGHGFEDSAHGEECNAESSRFGRS